MIREPRDPDDDLLPLVDEAPAVGRSPLASWPIALMLAGIVAVVAFGLPAVLGL